MLRLIIALFCAIQLDASTVSFSCFGIPEGDKLDVHLQQVAPVESPHHLDCCFSEHAKELKETLGTTATSVRAHVNVAEHEVILPEYKHILFDRPGRNCIDNIFFMHQPAARWMMENHLLNHPPLQAYLDLLIEIDAQSIFTRELCETDIGSILADKLDEITSKSLSTLLKFTNKHELAMSDFICSFSTQYGNDFVVNTMKGIFPEDAPTFAPQEKTLSKLTLEDGQTLLNAFDAHIIAKIDALKAELYALYLQGLPCLN